jgi:Co/Zn/Cd efflux system component
VLVINAALFVVEAAAGLLANSTALLADSLDMLGDSLVYGPSAEVMGIVGVLVLLGNGICFLLLFRYRSADLNMRSTRLCSRNDIIANISVLLAAVSVSVFNASWPDRVIGAAIAALFLRSAFTVLRESILELRILNSQSTNANRNRSNARS